MLNEKTYVVYRTASPGQKIPVGEPVECRRAGRMDNTRDLLRLARKLYSSSTLDALEITVEPS